MVYQREKFLLFSKLSLQENSPETLITLELFSEQSAISHRENGITIWL